MKELAKKANMQEYYTIYRELCGTVHVSTTSLQNEYLILDDKGELKSFNCGPTDKDLEKLLYAACVELFLSLQSVYNLFRIDKKEQLDSIATKLKSLQSMVH